MITYQQVTTLLLFIVCLSGADSFAQSIGINTDAPDESAAVEIYSPDQGFLMPRSDTSLVNANGTPATGLIIYQSTDNRFYYFNGTKWLSLSTQSGAFEKHGKLVRQASGTDTDSLVFGRDTLPVSGEMIDDTLFFFNQQKGAFRGGMVTNDDVWAEEYLGMGSMPLVWIMVNSLPY